MTQVLAENVESMLYSYAEQMELPKTRKHSVGITMKGTSSKCVAQQTAADKIDTVLRV